MQTKVVSFLLIFPFRVWTSPRQVLWRILYKVWLFTLEIFSYISDTLLYESVNLVWLVTLCLVTWPNGATIIDIFFQFLRTSFMQNNKTAFYVGYLKGNMCSFNVQCTVWKQWNFGCLDKICHFEPLCNFFLNVLWWYCTWLCLSETEKKIICISFILNLKLNFSFWKTTFIKAKSSILGHVTYLWRYFSSFFPFPWSTTL